MTDQLLQQRRTTHGSFAQNAAISQAICNAIGPAPASARFHFAKDAVTGRVSKVWTPSTTPVTVNGQTVPVNFL